MTSSIDELMLQLETTSDGWVRGQPVRPGELGVHLQRLMDLARRDPNLLGRVHGQLDRVLDRLHEARAAVVQEHTLIPGRRRAIRAHACLRSASPPHLRVRV